MTSEQPGPNVNKPPSGIPRVSKLPVLSSRASRASLHESVEPERTTNAAKETQKPLIVSSFSRPDQAPSRLQPANGNPLVTRSNLPNGSAHGPKKSASTSISRLPGYKSTANTNKNPIQAQTRHGTNVENQENRENRGDLRPSSSQNASGQSSFDEFPNDTSNPDGASNVSQTPARSRAPRPSLSDRTMESIQMLPSTPKERRRSSFFSPVSSPMRPPPRPESSLSRNGSNDSSRPTTREGGVAKPVERPSASVKRAPASVKSTTKAAATNPNSTPIKTQRRSVSTNLNGALRTDQSSVTQLPKHAMPSTPTDSTRTIGQRGVVGTSTSKTVAARPSRARGSVSDAFGPSVGESSTRKAHVNRKNKFSENEGLSASAQTLAKPSPNSSAALREQIAAAKVAARKERAKNDSPQGMSMQNGARSEVEIHADSFDLAPRDGKHILRNRINAARMDGKLNIAALGLKAIPNEVLTMYDAAAMEESKVSWAEVVDLNRLIAADNEIDEVCDFVFPDKAADEYNVDDQAEGNQFGGLEMLDLHSNRLQALPMGLRRLERLTSLNLSHNKLENSAFEVISQVTSLKDLRLGHNTLSGSLPSSIVDLKSLERLDLRSNRLLGLPEALRELVGLRVLNVASNQLTALPMEALQVLPLTELDVSSNALVASLFQPGSRSGHPTLQNLNAANNSLAALTFDDTIDLPQIHTLDITNNHLTGLPPASGFLGLITLLAADNKIRELPVNFSSLRKLRNVNLSSNELRLLDSEIANMESLDSLILAANPLRDKKFLTMNASDIKRDLKARLAPPDMDDATPQDLEEASDAEMVPSRTLPSTSERWSLKANGILDLSGKRYSDSINDSLGSFLKSNEVKQLLLQTNVLTAVPPALWLGQHLRTLNLAGNAFSTDWVYDEIELPLLQDLNLSSCGLQTMEPMISQIHAPNLQTLNISANRISDMLPQFRAFYPCMTTLLSNDNRITSITADSLRGFNVVNLANNNIEQLPAEVGLLWNEGLRSLEIGGNAFRMPNYRILEKGTEATMRYLRDRLPESHEAVVMND